MYYAGNSGRCRRRSRRSTARTPFVNRERRSEFVRYSFSKYVIGRIGELLISQLCTNLCVVPSGRGLTSKTDDEAVDSALGLGELAQLTINNDVENSYDVSVLREITNIRGSV